MKCFLILTTVLGGFISQSFQASNDHVEIALTNDIPSDLGGSVHSEQIAEIDGTGNQECGSEHWTCVSCGYTYNRPLMKVCNYCYAQRMYATLVESIPTERRLHHWKCDCGFANNSQLMKKCENCRAERVYPSLADNVESISTDGRLTQVTSTFNTGTGNTVDNNDDVLSENREKTDENTDDSMGILAVSLICCLCLFCLASIVGVQRIIFTQHSSEYQSLEYEPLTDEQVNTDTVIEVNEEEEHRLPPDSRDYATEVCRSVCLASVCCAAWIIVPYYHWKERRQRRRENNLTRSQELL
eukprot:857546_1